MTSIFFALIILPLIFFILIALVFSSSLTNTRNDQWIANCPYPIYNGVAENVTIASDSTRITFYEVDYKSTGNNQTGTYFKCHFDDVTGNPSLSVVAKEYGHYVTFFSNSIFPDGWLGYVSDTIGIFFSKVPAWSNIAYNTFTAPAQITGMAWFNYVNLALIFMIILGLFMVIRGG